MENIAKWPRLKPAEHVPVIGQAQERVLLCQLQRVHYHHCASSAGYLLKQNDPIITVKTVFIKKTHSKHTVPDNLPITIHWQTLNCIINNN